MGMVNVGEKKIIRRYAEAKGKIILREDTIRKIKEGKIEKGDPFEVAEIAGTNAAKQTSLLIPYCHQIPLDHVKIDFSVGEKSIEVSCKVSAEAKTGVEMEAIVGLLIALATLWDMVKYLEKDKDGQYPYTEITEVRVTEKRKKE